MSAPILELTTAAVTRTQIVRFAGVGGDFNPMHHDEPFAHAAGQPSVFAMGQLTAAIVAEAVAEHFGTRAVRTYGIRFDDKVWPGDRLHITGTEGDPPADGGRRVELTVCREADGVRVARAWVVL